MRPGDQVTIQGRRGVYVVLGPSGFRGLWNVCERGDDKSRAFARPLDDMRVVGLAPEPAPKAPTEADREPPPFVEQES